jgi:hypothetical protein
VPHAQRSELKASVNNALLGAIAQDYHRSDSGAA